MKLLTGLWAWVVQRGSALLMISLLIVIPLTMIPLNINNYTSWQQAMASPFMVVAWSLFFIAIIAHAWVGIRDIILDYVHNLLFRTLSLSAVAVALTGCILWLLRVLLLNAGVGQ